MPQPGLGRLRRAGGHQDEETRANTSSLIQQPLPIFYHFVFAFQFKWECKADMDNAYRFGETTVVCEGYDYPEDPYVLRGSCGVRLMSCFFATVKPPRSNNS